MEIRLLVSRFIQSTSVVVVGVGLGVVAWTGCDSQGSGGDKQAKSQPPSSAGQQEKPSENPTKKGTTEETQKAPSPSEESPGGSARKPSPEGSGAGEADAEITDEELAKFAKVQKKLRPQKEKLRKKLDEAENREEAKKAQMEVMKATREATEKVGLAFERYRSIARRIRSDRELQKRLKKAGAKEPSAK